jgi:polyphosphate kinase
MRVQAMENFDHKAHFINRELSWLAFNERVLAQASDKKNPLLERLKFISIASSNLDEFFMVRVAGLKDQVKFEYHVPENKTQMTPGQQLREISRKSHAMVRKLYSVLTYSVLPALKKEGIYFVNPQNLTPAQYEFLSEYYHHHVFPVLTPLAIDASHPFPMLANKSLNLAVLLDPEVDEEGVVLYPEDEQRFAVVQVPSVLPRFIELPSHHEKRHYVLLEDVIQMFISTLFSGNQVQASDFFRITRNADITVDEESAEDLLEEIEKELKKRKRGVAVRLEVTTSMMPSLLDNLKDWLELEGEDIYSVRGPLDVTFFAKVGSQAEYDSLRFEPIIPQPPQDLFGEFQIFEAISKKDILMCHPYESFEPVVHFINQAAGDKNVLAIKQTLYRVGGNSPVVSALARAAENGKQVTVLLELKARFDEENNIVWAKKLEESGCHVIYGLYGLKTHSKITLVVRREEDKIRRYVHLSTGNYNDTTARIYTDIGMFTAREDFGYDASEFFNHLTGFGTTPDWKQITTAPNGLKNKFLDLIHNEIEKSTPEKPGRMIAKMNSLTDKDLILALYQASAHGIQIDLIIRGICCLRPGILGISENIRVSSLVGRFLEHSRIFYFQSGGDEQFYLSSADWMTRNMMGRVEILFPVVQENLKERIKHMLALQLSDNANRYVLEPNGVYRKVERAENEDPLVSQMEMYREAMRYTQERERTFHSLMPITTYE